MAATDIKTAEADVEAKAVRDFLGDDAKPVAAVLEKLTARHLARAWAGGLIEFGRVKHCVTGRPGVRDESVDERLRFSSLLIEDGVEWTGPKTTGHVRFAELWEKAKALPAVDKYRKYVQETPAGATEPQWKIVEIRRDEAEKLMALSVRLTDKGLGELF